MNEINQWKIQLAEALPLLGHRNWVVVADSAYPQQIAPGIETLTTGMDHVEVVRYVVEELKSASHITPKVWLDVELVYVPEADSPQASATRAALKTVLHGLESQQILHEEIISKLDNAGKMFKVLLLKTTGTVPYSSVFFELGCGYWDATMEKRIRASLRDN